MKRKVFEGDGDISLCAYLPKDSLPDYEDWRDESAQKGYNLRPAQSYEELCAHNRKVGYGVRAFLFGIKHGFEVLGLEKIFAERHEANEGSRKMLSRCGFTPNLQTDRIEKHDLT